MGKMPFVTATGENAPFVIPVSLLDLDGRECVTRKCFYGFFTYMEIRENTFIGQTRKDSAKRQEGRNDPLCPSSIAKKLFMRKYLRPTLTLMGECTLYNQHKSTAQGLLHENNIDANRYGVLVLFDLTKPQKLGRQPATPVRSPFSGPPCYRRRLYLCASPSR